MVAMGESTKEERDAVAGLMREQFDHERVDAWVVGDARHRCWFLEEPGDLAVKAYRAGAAAALADPRLVLEAGEKLLRGTGIVRLLLLGPPDDHGPFVELGNAISGQDDTVSVDANTLHEGWQKAVERRG